MKSSFCRFLIIAFLVFFAGIASGYFELKKRWEIDFDHQPLKIFTYVDPAGKRENYLYFIYTLTNKSEKPIPLNIDICLKIDMHHPDLVAAGYKPKVKFYQDSLYPFVDDDIAFTEEKLLGLPLGIRKDRVKELKDKLFYLNCQELRAKQEILPNEKIVGLAIFGNIDPQAKVFEIMVGGLIDAVKRRYPDEIQPDEVKDSHIERDLRESRMGRNPTYEYENRIRSIIYLCEGDEFNKQTQSFIETVIAPKWIIRNYGPITDKNTIKILVDLLGDENPVNRWGSWYLLNRLTGQSFNYDTEIDFSSEQNQKSIKLWQEWWYRNKEKLVYNKILNQFEIGEQPK